MIGKRIKLVTGDITTLDVDAIVNAANSSLLGGGGVDGAIHAAAGPQLKEYCVKLGGCPTGKAVITPGFDLPARYVIHTVGPVWEGGDENEPELLASCYRNSLNLAHENDCHSVAFPAISCGVYGYPVEKAVKIAVDTTLDFCKSNPEPGKIIFCCFSPDLTRAYQIALSNNKDG